MSKVTINRRLSATAVILAVPFVAISCAAFGSDEEANDLSASTAAELIHSNLENLQGVDSQVETLTPYEVLVMGYLYVLNREPDISGFVLHARFLAEYEIDSSRGGLTLSDVLYALGGSEEFTITWERRAMWPDPVDWIGFHIETLGLPGLDDDDRIKAMSNPGFAVIRMVTHPASQSRYLAIARQWLLDNQLALDMEVEFSS